MRRRASVMPCIAYDASGKDDKRKALGSRSIDDLPWSIDRGRNEWILDAARLDKINVAPQERFKVLCKTKELLERRQGSLWRELDQEVQVAGLRVEIAFPGGGSEQLQTRYAILATEGRQGLIQSNDRIL